MFQNPPDLFFSVIKGMAMATAIVAVGCYYGYTASGGPVGVGQATAKSMILNMVLVHLIGMMGSQIFWGRIRGRRSEARTSSGFPLEFAYANPHGVLRAQLRRCPKK